MFNKAQLFALAYALLCEGQADDFTPKPADVTKRIKELQEMPPANVLADLKRHKIVVDEPNGTASPDATHSAVVQSIVPNVRSMNHAVIHTNKGILFSSILGLAFHGVRWDIVNGYRNQLTIHYELSATQAIEGRKTDYPLIDMVSYETKNAELRDKMEKACSEYASRQLDKITDTLSNGGSTKNTVTVQITSPASSQARYED